MYLMYNFMYHKSFLQSCHLQSVCAGRACVRNQWMSLKKNDFKTVTEETFHQHFSFGSWTSTLFFLFYSFFLLFFSFFPLVVNIRWQQKSEEVMRRRSTTPSQETLRHSHAQEVTNNTVGQERTGSRGSLKATWDLRDTWSREKAEGEEGYEEKEGPPTERKQTMMIVLILLSDKIERT